MEQQINFIPCCNPAESRMDLFPLSRRYRPAIIKKHDHNIVVNPILSNNAVAFMFLYMLKDSVSLIDIAA